MTTENCEISVKSIFDFGWKTGINPAIGKLALRYNRGDILDIGCGCCQLLAFLKRNGWEGRYFGIDIQRYEGYEYPEDANVISGDALEMDFPAVDTAVLYDVLEHVSAEVGMSLISKALASSENALINVPKRNEEMWKYGIVEYHQLDKTHKHCGFSREELDGLIRLAGGKVINWEEHDKIDASAGMNLWKNRMLRKILFQLNKIFESQTFYAEMWCEIEPR